MRRNRLSLPSDLHLVGGEDASVHLTMGYLYDTFRLPFCSSSGLLALHAGKVDGQGKWRTVFN
jgi:hypothetical protein